MTFRAALLATFISILVSPPISIPFYLFIATAYHHFHGYNQKTMAISMTIRVPVPMTITEPVAMTITVVVTMVTLFCLPLEGFHRDFLHSTLILGCQSKCQLSVQSLLFKLLLPTSHNEHFIYCFTSLFVTKYVGLICKKYYIKHI